MKMFQTVVTRLNRTVHHSLLRLNSSVAILAVCPDLLICPGNGGVLSLVFPSLFLQWTISAASDVKDPYK